MGMVSDRVKVGACEGNCSDRVIPRPLWTYKERWALKISKVERVKEKGREASEQGRTRKRERERERERSEGEASAREEHKQGREGRAR